MVSELEKKLTVTSRLLRVVLKLSVYTFQITAFFPYSPAFFFASSYFVCQNSHVKANSHIPYRFHAVPLSYRSAKGLDCVFPIWFTHCGGVWYTYHVAPVPFPCHATIMPFRKRLLKATAQRGMGMAWERHGMCELASAVHRRHMGHLPAFGFFRLPRGVPRRLLL
jgi:hypothetical protein